MSYKIVETVERGKRVLSIVPKNWEQNGILKWPRIYYDKLKLDPNSKPDKSWLPMQCKVKRNALQSYDSAEIEMNLMSDVTDTEIEEEEPRGAPPVTAKKGFNFDLNDLLRSSITDQEGVTENEVSEQEIPAAIDTAEEVNIHAIDTAEEVNIHAIDTAEEVNIHAIDTAEDVNIQNVYLVTEPIATDLVHTQPDTHNAIILQKIDNLTNISTQLQNNLQNVLQKLASVTTLLEEYIKKITFKEMTNATSTNFKAISDVKMLQEFESSLENPDLKQELMKKLSIICSKGKGRGINNAYVLVDVMFTRKLMTECSWAGGTRKDNPKSCFKSYTHTINLFFEIIHDSDKDFTKTECDNFFKNVLRHSVARNSSRQLRCSAAKRRPRKNNSTKDEKTTCQKNNGGGTSNPTARPSTCRSVAEVDKENVDPVARNPQSSTSQSVD